MSKITLSSQDRVRISADFKNDIFVDISGNKDEICLSIDFYPTMQYFEIREKNGGYRQFFFRKKGDKKYFDFGFWEDAEVIFSINKVTNK